MAIKWKIDPAHSEIQFKVKHLMITTVTGYFKTFDLEVETDSDDFNTAKKIEFTADIDSIDTNRDNIFATWDLLPRGFRNASGLIGGFNREVTDAPQQLVQFEKALDFASLIIDNEINSATKKARSEAAYAQRIVLANNVAIFEEHSSVWKNKKEHLFAVMPHANGWQINSRDTTLGQVPEDVENCEGFVFRHKSGFMAVVKDKEVAIDFAGKIPL